MLKEFLEARRERIQNLINNGFEVEIKYKPISGDATAGTAGIVIVHREPWFCKCGTYWIKDGDDRGFTEAIELAEQLNLDKTIVEEFVKSLSK